MVQSPNCLWLPLVGLTPGCQCLHSTRESSTRPSIPELSHKGWGSIITPQLAGSVLPDGAQDGFIFWPKTDLLCTVFDTRIPLCKAASQPTLLVCYIIVLYKPECYTTASFIGWHGASRSLSLLHKPLKETMGQSVALCWSPTFHTLHRWESKEEGIWSLGAHSLLDFN